ncbi:hypothetical protein AWV80_33325 [Cupriavidus sp. UYMU48A]|nr:hypothetical protein AWV80_33325 [Cupriavidus sp. UYMU48A]
MDLLLDAICVVDREGRFLSITGACESIFGYKPEEMLGKPMIDFVFHGDRERTLKAVERIEAGYLQRQFENRYVRKDAVSRTSCGRRACPSATISGWRWPAIFRTVHGYYRKSDCCPITRRQGRHSGAYRMRPPALIPPGFAPIPRSAQDYTVLHALASGDECVTRKAIVRALGEDFLHYDQRRLDTQMRRLRRKVEQACGLQLPVSAVRGNGYRVHQRIVIDG